MGANQQRHNECHRLSERYESIHEYAMPSNEIKQQQNEEKQSVTLVTAVLSIVEQSPSMPRRVKFHSRIGAGDILLVAVGLVPVITEEVDSGISIL